MDISEDITKKKFVLILLAEGNYEDKLAEIIRTIDGNSRICYVCLSKPYQSILEYLKERKVNHEKFFFVDVMSSHYKKPKASTNCFFMEKSHDLSALKSAVKRVTNENNCRFVLFDNISSLFSYELPHNIIRFTHELNSEENGSDANKIFVVLKDSLLLSETFFLNVVKDLEMFTDKTIDLS